MNLENHFNMDVSEESHKKESSYVQNIDFVGIAKLLNYSVSDSFFDNPFSNLWVLDWFYKFILTNELPILDKIEKIEFQENWMHIEFKAYTTDDEGDEEVVNMLVYFSFSGITEHHIGVDIEYEYEEEPRCDVKIPVTDIEKGDTEKLLDALKQFSQIENTVSYL